MSAAGVPLRRYPILAILVPVVALAACGDGTTDKDAISKIITDGGRDPSTICDHLSVPLLKTFGTVADCRSAASAGPHGAAASTKIERLRITGERAVAAVTGRDGRTTISFVKDHGSWKVQTSRPSAGGG